MRAPGMSLMKMPIFTWMILVVQFLLVFAIPVITVALFLLMFQRVFGAQFFNVDAGADPLLWQHLFWIFGHPEVYILVLPSFGIVSEVLPVFSRKPLFGYKFVVFSGAAIGFVGWGVWAHHMFASGLGPVSVAVFSVSTMLIAIPTGVKIVNWTLTMWGGKLSFTTAMMFAIGLIVEFTIGGLSGVTHSVSPSDTQQTDTYYIVAHFHYVLFGGAVFGIFAGFYYWWPKMFGKMLSETLGKWNFWFMVVGMNLTFGPMHILGLQGQPRRMVVYPEKLTGEGFFNLHFWNVVASVGAYTLAIGIFLFLINVIHTTRKGAKAPIDPWDARSLEWLTDSPPKAHNFDVIPHVHALDEYFHLKYEEVDTDTGPRLVKVRTGEELHAEQEANADKHIHMPSPSYWPLVVGRLVADHGLRRHLHAPADRVRWSHLAAGPVRLGARAIGCRRQRLRPAAAGWRTVEGAGQCLRQRSPILPRPTTITGQWQWSTITLWSSRRLPRPWRRSRRWPHGHLHRAQQQQAGDVAVPRQRVPAVRRPHLHLHAVPRPPHRLARARHSCGTSR